MCRFTIVQGFGTPVPALSKGQPYFKNQYMLCTYYMLSLVLDTKDRNMNKTFFPLMKLWLMVEVDN